MLGVLQQPRPLVFAARELIRRRLAQPGPVSHEQNEQLFAVAT
jgi:hypothetical protein